MEGVVRAPSEFSITLGWPFSMTATHELVVPRSMPMILAMCYLAGFPVVFLKTLHYGRCGGRPLFFNGFGHRHEGGADHAVVQEVALLQDLQHGVRLGVRGLRADRL